jgi:hypothetical protein
MVNKSCTCYSCGRTVEFSDEELPCEALRGWLVVSCLKGSESVDRYSFCSFGCLKQWVTSRMSVVPEVFLKSLGEEISD